MKRVITALFLIPFIAWVTLASPQWVFYVVLAATGLLAYSEFDNIAAASGIARAGWPGMAAGLVLLLAPNPAVVLVLIAMLGMALALRVNNFAAALPAAAAFSLGVVYMEPRCMQHCTGDMSESANFYSHIASARMFGTPVVRPLCTWRHRIHFLKLHGCPSSLERMSMHMMTMGGHHSIKRSIRASYWKRGRWRLCSFYSITVRM